MKNAPHSAGTRNFIIGITRNQQKQLKEFFINVEPGGAIMAQVFIDGMRCVCLTPDQAGEIAKIVGGRGFIATLGSEKFDTPT